MRDNHFKIIIPSFNNEKWIKACINSVKSQDYDNYQCIIVDDLSTDDSINRIVPLLNEKVLLVENKVKKLALRNICEAIEISKPAPEDVIVTLDGDDFLANKSVLSTLNRTYLDKECWMTYGSYMEYPSMRRGKFSKEIADSVIKYNAFREIEWSSSHLRTFKFKLWREIDKKDLLMDNGKHCDGAWDMAFMFPMLEMAGERSSYIRKILHIYNRANVLNEDKVRHHALLDSERRIRNMKRYKRIDTL